MGYLKRIIKSFSKNERLVFAAAFLVFLISSFFIGLIFFSSKTSLTAVAGGQYSEGVVGQPIFVNPIFSGSNEADQDLSELIYSSLSKMAESYKASSDGKTWLVRLKEGIRWDDGQPITADDVIFTISVIQNVDSRSPLYPMWQKVKTERVSELEFKISLPEAYSFFQNTLDELKPVPKHIFAGIPAENLRLSEYNLEPVGSGPFRFSSMKTQKSGFIAEYYLARSNGFFGDRPYLDNIVFKFYDNEKELIKAFNSGSIDGFGGLMATDIPEIKISHQLFEMRMPRYYAVFFNTSAHPALKEKNVRLALNYATDKSKLIQDVFGGRALAVDGPLVPGMEGYDPDVYPQESFSIEKANNVLEGGGWLMQEDGVRAKTIKGEKIRLEFDLVAPEISFLEESAKIISESWAMAGVKANVLEYSFEKINEETIRTRNYQMIIFGNIFSNNGVPDLSSFWHSSERFYPGLNLALYENKTADSLIESIRKATDPDRRQSSLSSLQSLIVQDSPGVFLFSPNYFYASKTSLGGFDERFITLASKRFQNIFGWYVKTARIFK
jgi:peptide/nickel transport system substrate-binding protein